jgi:hypothetical protein
MARKRVFTSFDYDHDDDLRIMLVCQSKLEDSPFEMADWSIKEALTGDWKKKARERIKKVDLMVVVCGQHTHTANGVSAELEIAQEERVSYFLLHGRKNTNCTKPVAAKASDKIYDWTWDNLNKLIGGAR